MEVRGVIGMGADRGGQTEREDDKKRLEEVMHRVESPRAVGWERKGKLKRGRRCYADLKKPSTTVYGSYLTVIPVP